MMVTVNDGDNGGLINNFAVLNDVAKKVFFGCQQFFWLLLAKSFQPQNSHHCYFY